MHKFTVLFCVFLTVLVTSAGVFSFYNQALAAVPVHIVGDDVTQKEINKKLEDLHEKLITDRQADSEQRLNETVSATDHQGDFVNADNVNRAKLAQEQSMDDTNKRHTGSADALCTEASVMPSLAGALETKNKIFSTNTQANMSVTNAEEGTPAANGRIDYNVQLFDERKQHCSSKGSGGSETYCGGSDNQHLSVETLLSHSNIKTGDEVDQKLGYLQKMLFSKVFSNINPDLLEEPKTEVKNIMVEQDRLKAAQGVAMAAFHNIRAARAPSEAGGEAKQWMTQVLQQNKFSSESIQDLMGDSPSYEAQLDFIGRRIYMSPEWAMSLADTPENSTRHIPIYLGWNNILLFEIYKMLQIIALNTGQTVAENISDDFVDLETRIRALNARN